eukprot:6177417-Pleurochrysis_carterae.AAC.9
MEREGKLQRKCKDDAWKWRESAKEKPFITSTWAEGDAQRQTPPTALLASDKSLFGAYTLLWPATTSTLMSLLACACAGRHASAGPVCVSARLKGAYPACGAEDGAWAPHAHA